MRSSLDPAPMPTLRLRDATPDDLALAYAITEDAMRSYVEQTWGNWNSSEQQRLHLANFRPETHRFILVDDSVVGLLAKEEFPTYVWLIKLYLLRAYRGRGIGSKVLEDLLEDARSQGKQVTLQVLRVNRRAQLLYARHGFRITEERKALLFMTSGT